MGEGVHEKRSFRLGKIPPKGGTTNFSFLALADPRNRRDRSAPLARRLAAGVGSGVAPSRRVIGRMGSAQLARQARSAVAQYERVLGRSVATTEKIGGRNVSRLTFWRADVAQEQRLHRCRSVVACARYRGEYRHFQRN